jgi:DoxX-like family
MRIGADLVAVVLAVVLVISATIKLTRREPYVGGYLRVGVPEDRLDYLAFTLLAGAAGLALGLVWPPIGFAAAIGVVCYFALAVAAHIRADDARNLPTPVTVVAIAVAALILRATTL